MQSLVLPGVQIGSRSQPLLRHDDQPLEQTAVEQTVLLFQTLHVAGQLPIDSRSQNGQKSLNDPVCFILPIDNDLHRTLFKGPPNVRTVPYDGEDKARSNYVATSRDARLDLADCVVRMVPISCASSNGFVRYSSAPASSP
jgi:hypothetical protein